MTTPDDLPFLDVAWLATDAQGCAAIFFSGGGGFIPESARSAVLSDFDLEAAVLRLPAYSDPAKQTGRPHDAFIEFVERGLYVFDCARAHSGELAAQRTYERAGSPANARAAVTLPGELAAIARGTVLPQVRFAEQAVLRFDA